MLLGIFDATELPRQVLRPSKFFRIWLLLRELDLKEPKRCPVGASKDSWLGASLVAKEKDMEA